MRGKTPRDGVSMDPAYLYDDVTPRLQSLPAYTAYVKIAEGCDRPCSFCIIPKLRGGQRSRTRGVGRARGARPRRRAAPSRSTWSRRT